MIGLGSGEEAGFDIMVLVELDVVARNEVAGESAGSILGTSWAYVHRRAPTQREASAACALASLKRLSAPPQKRALADTHFAGAEITRK